MSKTKKPASRRPSKKKLQKMEQRRKLEERTNKLLEERARYTWPTENSEAGIEACKQGLKEGETLLLQRKMPLQRMSGKT